MRLAVIAVVLLAACSSRPLQRKPASALKLHYQSWASGTGGAAVSTSIYRDLLAKSMYSECRMEPHDSLYFDRLARRCGSLHAVFRGAARLLLERAATTDFLIPVRLRGQLKWLDPIGPSPCDE